MAPRLWRRLLAVAIFLPFAARAGIIITSGPLSDGSHDIELCVLRNPWLPEASSLNSSRTDLQLADFTSLGSEEVAKFCQGEDLGDDRFRGEVLSAYGIFQLCDYDSTTEPFYDQLKRLMRVAWRVMPAAVVMVGTGDLSSSSKDLFTVPAVTFSHDYLFTTEHYPTAELPLLICSVANGSLTGLGDERHGLACGIGRTSPPCG